MCGPGSCWTVWPRDLADSCGTRPRVLGDSGPGSCLTHACSTPVRVLPAVTFFAVGCSRPQTRRRPVVLVEMRLVEQRYQAVLEVLNDGASVVDVARRRGVARQTVHDWLRRYAAHGLAGLADKTSRPLSCPHQMSPVVEARIVAMRREHPGWGPRTILFWLAKEDAEPLPGRTSVERCLIRHGLVTPQARKRKRSDYKRWERSRAMELWQMDIVGGCEAGRWVGGEDRVGHR